MKWWHDIYFYNVNGLLDELKQGTFSEHRAVKHLIVTAIMGGIGFTIPVTFKLEEGDTSNVFAVGIISSFAMFIVTAVISYYGIYLTYQANAKGDGKEYFMRFAALSLPIGIRLVVLFILLSLLLGLIGIIVIPLFQTVGLYIIQLSAYVLYLVFFIMFYIRMYNYLSDLAGTYK